MPDTVFDCIRLVFPISSRLQPGILPNQQVDDQANTAASGLPGSYAPWFSVPYFPTDLFAIAAYLLETAGAFAQFDPDPDAISLDGPNPNFTLSGQLRDQAVELGKLWEEEHRENAAPATPKDIQQLWEKLLKSADKKIRFPAKAAGQVVRADEQTDWWSTALRLLIIADEASETVGSPLTGQDPFFWQYIYEEKIGKHGFQPIGEPIPDDSSGSATFKTRGSSLSLAMVADTNVVNVFPKSRISISGCSTRNFSRNLALLPKAGLVRCHWQMQAMELKDDDDMPIDILVIPFPFEIAAKSFVPLHKAKDSMPNGSTYETRRYWGNFRVNQDWLEKSDIVDTSIRLLLSAKNDVKTVNGVVFPEYSLNYETFRKLCISLKEVESDLEFVIAGTSSNCDSEPDTKDNYVMTCVWHRMNVDFRNGEGGDPAETTIQLMSSRRKHHRWMLSPKQLESYALTSSLDPRVNWWENHHIGRRELHFHPFRKRSLFTAMICEDLARSDPCHEVLRSVAPNLVIVLLMDGPQINSRWAARYASSLSDDPGCSVLTLTSQGLVKRTNQTKFFDNQEAIAYFSGPFGETAIHLPSGDGAKAVLMTLTSVRDEMQQTIDGRCAVDARTWKFTTSQPIKPADDVDLGDAGVGPALTAAP